MPPFPQSNCQELPDLFQFVLVSPTKLKDRFVKRDVFLATSDLCRSFVVLSALGLFPAIRIALYDIHHIHNSLVAFAILALLLLAMALLGWKRMVRFRQLSETTVFGAYLATVKESQNCSPCARACGLPRGLQFGRSKARLSRTVHVAKPRGKKSRSRQRKKSNNELGKDLGENSELQKLN